MGRHKTPQALKKLQGTYRADRDNGAENLLSNYLEKIQHFLPPDSITDDYCKTHYSHHINFLSNLNIITYSDIPEINTMYEALQEYRKVYVELQKIKLSNVDDYEKLSNLLLKYGKRFSELAVKYCISPTARNKLTLEELQINKEVEEQKSLTAKLIGKKKK
jgi:phage terminase small subunit